MPRQHTSASRQPQTTRPSQTTGNETRKAKTGEADFGFRRVGEDEKTRLVREVFDHVASRYDLMNDLMSGGIHRRWKAQLIDRLQPRPGETLLDLAGGTGDVGRRFLGRAGKTAASSSATLIPR